MCSGELLNLFKPAEYRVKCCYTLGKTAKVTYDLLTYAFTNEALS